jgi:glutamine synthetase
MTLEEARAFLRENRLETVLAAGVDQAGVLRGKRLTAAYFLDVAEQGLTVPWSILNTGPMDEAAPGVLDTGIPNVVGVPDLATLTVAGWEENAAIVMMDWRWPGGSPCPYCPRSELRRQVAAAAAMGFEARFALELEFYVLPTPIAAVRAGKWASVEPAAVDVHCYALYEGHFHEPLFAALRRDFPEAIEGGGPEWGRGQFEINLRPRDPLAMADLAVRFKTAVKQRAAALGQSATFMAKLREDLSGNSGHIHQSLIERASGRPAFHDGSDPSRMSPVMRGYLAGQLDALLPTTLCFAPYVNSYKRFRDESLAGILAGWGVDNRTVGLRALTTSPGSCRVEHRIGGADLNPYVAFAAALGAGLRGVRQGLPLPEPLTGNAYRAEGIPRVPPSLADAVALFERSAVVREILAAPFAENLAVVARLELEAFATIVTDLERRRCFEMV